VQARARRTRDKIVNQARRAFAERGFEATNLTEHILTPAGVSVGSFYHQFTNKREVLLEIFATTLAARREVVSGRLQNCVGDDFATLYRTGLDTLLDDVEVNPDVWHIQWREYESPDPEIRAASLVGQEGWNDTAARMIARSYSDPHPNVALAAEMSVYVGAGLVREFAHMSHEQRTARRRELVDACVAFVDGGVARLLGADNG
jgi:AcrR family transcriptional regulator